jgi:hypothetical protein
MNNLIKRFIERIKELQQFQEELENELLQQQYQMAHQAQEDEQWIQV